MINRDAPATISIMFATLESAVAAIRADVHNYLITPCKVEEILGLMRQDWPA